MTNQSPAGVRASILKGSTTVGQRRASAVTISAPTKSQSVEKAAPSSGDEKTVLFDAASFTYRTLITEVNDAESLLRGPNSPIRRRQTEHEAPTFSDSSRNTSPNRGNDVTATDVSSIRSESFPSPQALNSARHLVSMGRWDDRPSRVNSPAVHRSQGDSSVLSSGVRSVLLSPVITRQGSSGAISSMSSRQHVSKPVDEERRFGVFLNEVMSMTATTEDQKSDIRRNFSAVDIVSIHSPAKHDKESTAEIMASLSEEALETRTQDTEATVSLNIPSIHMLHGDEKLIASPSLDELHPESKVAPIFSGGDVTAPLDLSSVSSTLGRAPVTVISVGGTQSGEIVTCANINSSQPAPLSATRKDRYVTPTSVKNTAPPVVMGTSSARTTTSSTSGSTTASTEVSKNDSHLFKSNNQRPADTVRNLNETPHLQLPLTTKAVVVTANPNFQKPSPNTGIRTAASPSYQTVLPTNAGVVSASDYAIDSATESVTESASNEHTNKQAYADSRAVSGVRSHLIPESDASYTEEVPAYMAGVPVKVDESPRQLYSGSSTAPVSTAYSVFTPTPTPGTTGSRLITGPGSAFSGGNVPSNEGTAHSHAGTVHSHEGTVLSEADTENRTAGIKQTNTESSANRHRHNATTNSYVGEIMYPTHTHGTMTNPETNTVRTQTSSDTISRKRIPYMGDNVNDLQQSMQALPPVPDNKKKLKSVSKEGSKAWPIAVSGEALRSRTYLVMVPENETGPVEDQVVTVEVSESWARQLVNHRPNAGIGESRALNLSKKPSGSSTGSSSGTGSRSQSGSGSGSRSSGAGSASSKQTGTTASVRTEEERYSEDQGEEEEGEEEAYEGEENPDETGNEVPAASRSKTSSRSKSQTNSKPSRSSGGSGAQYGRETDSSYQTAGQYQTPASASEPSPTGYDTASSGERYKQSGYGEQYYGSDARTSTSQPRQTESSAFQSSQQSSSYYDYYSSKYGSSCTTQKCETSSGDRYQMASSSGSNIQRSRRPSEVQSSCSPLRREYVPCQACESPSRDKRAFFRDDASPTCSESQLRHSSSPSRCTTTSLPAALQQQQQQTPEERYRDIATPPPHDFAALYYPEFFCQL